MPPLILIVDDEPDLVLTLEYNLRKAGYDTRSAGTGSDALAAAFASPLPDLVLLDLMLPDISGTEICRRLRSDSRTQSIPVVMLTAKGEEIDRVVGFEVGADDYVLKPFSVRELILRIQVILKRSSSAEGEQDLGLLRFGRLCLDPQGHNIEVDGKAVSLTALEFRLLQYFITHKGNFIFFLQFK